MAVAGVQTSQVSKDKELTLKGDASLPAAENTLTLTIPADQVAPTGRKLKIRWTLVITEEVDP